MKPYIIASLLQVSLLIITGCNPSTPAAIPAAIPASPAATAISAAATNSPSATDQLIPNATFTHAATFTPVSSSTLTATTTATTLPTDTATVMPTATPSRVQPGIYNSGNCASYRVGWSVRIEFCVDHVEVLEDYSMIFNVSWTSYMSPEDLTVYKRSDIGNSKMYVMDNLGNRYDHFAVGGSAAKYTLMTNGGTAAGTFSFHPAAPGAFTFTFYDDDNGVATHGIALTTPVKLYEYLALEQYPFRLKYPLKYWQLGTTGDGQDILTHLTIDKCAISEVYPSTPQGTLINNIKIGEITYNIYRYYGQDMSVREYQVVAGVEGIDPNAPPLVSVTIPLDNAQQCILDASEVLANLQQDAPTNR